MQVSDKFSTAKRNADEAVNTEAFEYFKTLNELQAYLYHIRDTNVSLTHAVVSLTHSLTLSLTRSLAHSLTHSSCRLTRRLSSTSTRTCFSAPSTASGLRSTQSPRSCS